MGNSCARINLEHVNTDSMSSVQQRQRHWTDSTQPSSASHAEEMARRPKSSSTGSAGRKSSKFSFNYKRKDSEFPIVQEAGTLEIGNSRSGFKYTSMPIKKRNGEFYRSDTNDEMMSIDIDLILGTPPDSPGVIHARWGEPVEDPDEEETCMDFKGNPFRVGFCINCQKQHEIDASGEVKTVLEYKRISHFNAWQLQLPANPNISVHPDAVVGVGRANTSHSRRNLTFSNLSDSSRESDVDLTEILRQRRDILLKLQGLKYAPSQVPSTAVYSSTGSSASSRSAQRDPSNEDWL
ncbi:hypothetical protein SDRG_01107 [Saprolegnia diclina VS20]|uniref:Uncharacterized protein n=1 Tax=Saprolegnia diclina (strain VS20) TaxID=1156394 RepID=T0S7N1_SAPDV|nr:hypothetical protein SDRG_01107 [Saprolegnia diclina VS20]EQC41128.1 hypothetical protein SDRG_01107 [Saprolegnia diclina VS20]|eukprot:XP_008604842.1 hypothetical protein SDRG_01107 [Saprolegnia diclina VS20]